MWADDTNVPVGAYVCTYTYSMHCTEVHTYNKLKITKVSYKHNFGFIPRILILRNILNYEIVSSFTGSGVGLVSPI